MAAQPELSLAEWAVLALLCERPAHGWPIVRVLAPDGEIGAVWTVRRALVYRALDALEARRLIAAARTEPSDQGPSRTIHRVTPAGRRAVARWLETPVEHVRDLRSALLLKLVLGGRAGVDQRSMLERQLEHLGEIEGRFAARLAAAPGSDDLLVAFRLEATRAASRFVEARLGGARMIQRPVVTC